jgi:hypothetical protein
MAYTYGSSLAPEDATKQGLGSASTILSGQMGQNRSYPTWYGSQLKSPTQMDYSSYRPNQAYKTTGGLMGGDYDRLEQAFQAPVKQAYQENLGQIKNIYGGNGLYGSSGGNMMSGALGGAQNQYQTGLADATARRYAFQSEDLDRRIQEQQFGWKMQSGRARMTRANLVGIMLSRRRTEILPTRMFRTNSPTILPNVQTPKDGTRGYLRTHSAWLPAPCPDIRPTSRQMRLTGSHRRLSRPGYTVGLAASLAGSWGQGQAMGVQFSGIP